MIGYSLQRCFRGALLGAVLGEAIAPSRPQALGGAKTLPDAAPALDLGLGQILRASTAHLIQFGDFQPHSWQRLTSAPTPTVRGMQLLVASLPLALFWHENPLQLQPRLQALLRAEAAPAEMGESLWLLAAVIAQVLQPPLAPREILRAIAEFPDLAPTLQPLVVEIQELLDQQAGLHQARRSLAATDGGDLNHALALALYCFLSTPTTAPLAVLRAVHPALPLVPVLTGVLGGAANGPSSFPWPWRLHLAPASIQEMEKMADQLLAVWSGSCLPLPESTATTSPSILAIAAPRILRPR